MHVAETLLSSSVESFLRPEDLSDLRAALSDLLLATENGDLSEEVRTNSVHSVVGHTTADAMQIYEPRGRAESMELPPMAQKVLDAAGERAIPAIRKVLPSAKTFDSWIFVSYGADQFITPHIDLLAAEDSPERPKSAGISIPLTPASEYDGGEFFIETTTDPRLWGDEGADPIRTWADCDFSADWYRSMRRTRWQVKPEAGDAVIYGSQLTHGTEPVKRGRVDKVIGFLLA